MPIFRHFLTYVINVLYNYLNNKGLAWDNNLQYLKDAHKLGTQFILSPDLVVKGGTLLEEINYLVNNHIPWTLF